MIGRGLAVVGVAGVLASTWLHWLEVTVSRGSFHRTLTRTAAQVPVQFLWDSGTRAHEPSVLVVLIPAAILGVVGLVVRRGAGCSLLGGGLALAAGAVYIVQVNQSIDASRSQLRGLASPALRDVLGVAPAIAFGGGAAIVVGAVLMLIRRGPGGPGRH